MTPEHKCWNQFPHILTDDTRSNMLSHAFLLKCSNFFLSFLILWISNSYRSKEREGSHIATFPASSHPNKHLIIHHYAMTDESCWRILENVSNLIYMLMVCWDRLGNVADFVICSCYYYNHWVKVEATSDCTSTIYDQTNLVLEAEQIDRDRKRRRETDVIKKDRVRMRGQGLFW